MKTYLAMIVPVVVLIVVLVAGYISGPALETPKDHLYAQIDAKVELAQRMLHVYNPVNPRVHALLNPTTTQPFEVDADRWRDSLEPPTDADEKDPVAMLWQQIEAGSGQLSAVRARHGEIAGEIAPPEPLPSGANEAIEAIRGTLAGDQQTLDTALATVREAFSLPSEGEASPTDHPGATRVEATILFYKAELLRTHAALARRTADEHRGHVARLVRAWQAVDLESRSLKRELTGEAVPVVEEATPADDAAAAPPPAKPAVPDGSGGGNLLRGLFKRAAGGGAAPRPPAEAPTPAPAEEPSAQPAPEDAAQPAPRPAPRAMPPAPPIGRRIAELSERRAKASAELQQIEDRVKQLTAAVEATTSKLQEVRKRAVEAHAEMAQMEQAGVDVNNAASVDPFVARYNKLAAEYREASREATILERGAIRNARPDTGDDREMLKAPLVAADAAQPMQPEVGLNSLQAEQQAAQNLAKTTRALIEEMDRQLADLTGRKEAVEKRLAKLTADSDQLREQMSTQAGQALAMLVQAADFEGQALTICTEDGASAAERARSAAERHKQFVSASLTRENHPETPSRKLTEMRDDTFPVAHVALLRGDFDFLAARIYAQKSVDLARHQRMLAALTVVGVKVEAPKSAEGTEEPVAEEVPADAEPVTAEAAPAGTQPADATAETQPSDAAAEAKPADEPSAETPAEPAADQPPADEPSEGPAGPEALVKVNERAALTDGQAAVAAAEACRRNAIILATTALKVYEDTLRDLKELWVVSAQVAAVQYLIAGLETDENRPARLKEAQTTFQRAVRGREQDNRTAVYRQIMTELARAQAGS